MRDPRPVAALVAVLPALAVGVYFLMGDLAVLLDPCHGWGGAAPAGTQPGGPCRDGWASSSETLASYLLTALAVKGTLLAGVALGWRGIAGARTPLALAGAGLLILVGVPLMLGGTGLLVWLSAALVLLAAWGLATTRARPA